MSILGSLAILLSPDPVQHTQPRKNQVFPKQAGWFEWKLRRCFIEQWRLNNHPTSETDVRRATDAQKMECILSVQPFMHTIHMQKVMQALRRSSRHINLLSVFKLHYTHLLHTPTHAWTHKCILTSTDAEKLTVELCNGLSPLSTDGSYKVNNDNTDTEALVLYCLLFSPSLLRHW